MSVGVKDLYNIGLNDRGYILRGSPSSPVYRKSVIQSQIDRLAISDIAYSDFSGSGLFYIAQTDWSAGIKNEKVWKDDAKFYYSSNIDAFSEQGTLKLFKELSIHKDFGVDITCGVAASVLIGSNILADKYYGGEDDGSGNVKIYKYASGSFTDIAGTTFTTNQNVCSQLINHKNKLFALTVGSGNTWVVASYSGTPSWTDYTTAILAVITGASLSSARAGVELAGTLYIGLGDPFNEQCSIVSTGDGGTTWTEELFIDTNKTIVSMEQFDGKIYYILYGFPVAELRVFDPSDSSDVIVRKFTNVNMNTWGVGDKYLKNFGGKLVITIPNDRIYEFDGSNLTRIFRRDDDKISIGREADSYLNKGCVEQDDRLYWSNLVYDGESFFNWKKPYQDANYDLLPIFVDENNIMYTSDTNDESILYVDGSSYKSTLANNKLIFSEMAPITSIDKLIHSASLIFDKLAANEQLKLEYSIDDRATWNDISGVMTVTTEGSSTTKREIFVPNNIIFSKIWWRLTMRGTTTTPKIRDFILAYKPRPDYKNRWNIRVDSSNKVKLLNGQTEERDGDEVNAEIWNMRALKQKVVFEDVDYVECSLVAGMSASQTSALVDSTKRFPRQGRIRAVSGGVSEEMYYTSAESNKITGITRGVRGTKAIAYVSGQTLSNSYDVYLENTSTDLTFTDENKTECTTEILLIEA